MHLNRDRATVKTGGAAMHDDATRMHDRTGWSGTRRTLLSAAAGLCLPTLLPRGNVATPVPPTPSGLRDFAYVCAALTLEAQERDDLKPVGDIRYKASELALTPEAFVAAGYSPEQAQRLLAGGARQVCIYSAENTDESRLLVLNLVEGTTPEGADDILQLFRDILGEQNVSDLAAPDVAPDADNAFLGAGHGTPSGP